MPFVRLTLYPRLVRDPIDLPRFAAVIGECLFEVGRILGDLRPDVANEDHSSVIGFLVVELTDSILEFADRRRQADCAVFPVGPIETPLMRLRVVKTYGNAFDVTRGAVRFELVEGTAAVPELASF